MRLVAPLVLAACGSHAHAVDLGDGASEVGLSCNQPQKLLAASASIPRLAASSLGSQLAVAWTADDATLGSAKITLAGTDRIAAVDRDAYAVPGNWTGVSLAMTDQATLVALGRQDGHSTLVVNGGMPIDTTVQILAPGAAVATGGTPAFALAGEDSATGKASVLGVGDDGGLTGPVALGVVTARVITVRIAGGLAAALVLPSNTCELVPIDAAITRAGAATMFGVKQRCTQAAATYVDDATGSMLHYHDDGGAVMTVVLAPDLTLHGGGAIEMPGGEPRGAATSAGTWVTLATAGMLEAVLIDGTGKPGTRVKLGAIGDATSQTVVTAADTAYALWLDDDLEIARLCP
jgi:hypothetical protein